jgi:hypothetical protein
MDCAERRETTLPGLGAADCRTDEATPFGPTSGIKTERLKEIHEFVGFAPLGRRRAGSAA